jgi:PAS domain S-box-containing protein
MTLTPTLPRALALALVCALLQAVVPRMPLGVAELAPWSLALGVAAAARIGHGRTAGWAALAGIAGAEAWLLSGALSGAALWAMAGGRTLVAAVQLALFGAALGRGAARPGPSARDGDHDTAGDPRALDDGPGLRRLLWAALGAGLAGALGHGLLSLTLPAASAPALHSHLALALGRLLADAAGLVVGAAIVWTWIGRPRTLWRSRRRQVALPLLAMLAVLLPGIAEVARRDDIRLQARFEAASSERLWRTQRLLEQTQDLLTAMQGQLTVAAADGQPLRPAAFDALLASWQRRMPGLSGAGWLHREGGGHAWTAPQATAGARLPPLGEAAWRQPQTLLLANAGSQQDTRVTLLRPVGRTPDTALSLVHVSLQLDRLLAEALPAADDPNLVACLIDGHPAAGSQRLAGPPHCEDGALGKLARVAHHRVMLADHPLDLMVAEPASADDRVFSAAWMLALPAMAGSMLLATLLLALTGRLARIEERVNARTRALQAEVEERRQAEAAAAASEQRFRAIFDSVHIGVTLVDTEGVLRMVNPAFCTMMGCAADALLGRPLDDIRLPDVTEDDGTAAAMAGGQGTRQRYLTPDGRVLQVATSLRTLHDTEGRPLATVGALQDLTPVLRLREAEREREQAEIARRAQSDFLARLSHELRTPLNAILGFAQALDHGDQDTLDGPPARHALARIRQAGWHLQDMINDVLDLSRMEAGHLRLTLEPVSLPEVAQDALAIVEPAAARAGVQLALSLSPSAEAVQADPVRLRQVLINLLANAVRYNHPGGRAELRARAGGVGDVRIEVHDTGPGLDEAGIAQLFVPFQRLTDPARARTQDRADDATDTDGTGIGLVISRRLAQAMGGDIEVSSQPGEGSVFTLCLPRAVGRPPRDARDLPLATASAEMPALNPPALLSPLMSHVSIGQVLYIEDRASDRAVMQALLAARPGIALRCVGTAAEGRAAMADIDLLLLDLDLPDAPGLALLRALRAEAATRELPVIVVSGDSHPARIDEAFDAGATEYLTKPLEANGLLRAVDQVLQRG